MRSGCIAILLGLVFAGGALAGEQRVTIEQIAAAIEKHITAQSAAHGGYCRVKHEGRELELKLVRIHMEYLADLGGGVQFACVDLIGTDGPVYDVDFFLAGGPDGMAVTETTVHKVNGQPLYAWEQKKDGTWKRVPVEDASPRLLGVLQGEDAFDFTYRVKIPTLTGPAQMWFPLAQSDDYQTVKVEGITAPTEVRTLDEPKHGNKVLYLTGGPELGGKVVEVRYKVRRKEKSPYSVTGPSPKADLEPERLVPNEPSFREIAEKATQGKSTEIMRARALYDHVIESLRYAKFGPGWGRGDAKYACDAKSGNCTDYHAYFIALARSIGIPARFAIGAAIPSERDDGGTDGYHCWAEFHVDGQWWPVDISEADKNSPLATYYFGHQPANRFEFTRGRDLVVDPAPASGPINFLAMPLLEVEGKPVKAPTEFLFRRIRGEHGPGGD